MTDPKRREATRAMLESTVTSRGVPIGLLALFLSTLVAVPVVDQAHALRREAIRADDVAAMADAPMSPGGALVEATIHAIAAPPKPGSVPYKDCLIALHLVDVKTGKGPPKEAGLLVFAWGMRDMKWTPTATLKPGTRLKVQLQPWSAMESTLGSINRIELPDDELLLMTPWWAEKVLPAQPTGTQAMDLLKLIPFRLPSVKDLRDFDIALDEYSVVRDHLIPLAQYALLRTLGQGNEQTERQGDWLYLRQDIDHLTGPGFLEPSWKARRQRIVNEWEDPPRANPLPALTDFRDQLEEQGIRLLVLPVPVKPSIHPEPYSGNEMNLPVRNPSFRQFIEALGAEQIQVFDPAETLLAAREAHGRAYLKTDTHWTPAAMEAVADGLSERLLTLGWVRDRKTQWAVGARTISGTGDLIGNLGLSDRQHLLPEEHVEVHPVLDGSTADQEAEVLLLGDSFSNIYSQAGLGWGTDSGLPQHLARALGAPVDWVTRNAGGASATRQAVEAADLGGKKVVVLQFAERELSFGDWQLVTLPSGRLAVDEGSPPTKEDPSADAFHDHLTGQVEEAGDQLGIRGKNGFLFFVPELRHLAAGSFWGEAARAVGRAPDPAHRDPMPAILDFHSQLEKAGVRLIFVPVPPKAALYPDYLGPSPSTTRVDPQHQAFYARLRENGVEVIDLVPEFQKARDAGGPPLYCRTDTHWSGRAVELVAKVLVEALGSPPSAAPTTHLDLQIERRSVEIQGDLLDMVSPPRPGKETLPLAFVTDRGSPVQPLRESPVLLLGDSHNLVFHAGGDMHASGAGLADHLAYRLGYPVDLLAVRGSGATPSRISLLRRRDNLAGKHVVIWVLSAREFTEGQGWRKVPVIR